jgi:Tfp pilus assembly protein PilX
MEMTSGHSAHRQRGDILLVTLIFLLVFLLGLVVSTRDGAVTTLATGNTLARQKNVQITDIVLRQLETQLLNTSNGMPLETAATGQPWWRVVPAGTAAPAASYWDSCLGNNSTASRCGSISASVNGQALPYTAYVAVQPTGRWDSTSCGLGPSPPFIAAYYDVFIYVKESNGATAANTETVFRLCTRSQS